MAPLTFDRRTFLKASAASGRNRIGDASAPAPPRSPSSASFMSARATISAGIRPTPWPRRLSRPFPGVTVVEDENVPETDACAKTMESMINLDGANIILGHVVRVL